MTTRGRLLCDLALKQGQEKGKRKSDDIVKNLTTSSKDDENGSVGSQNEDVMQHPSHTNQKDDDVPVHLAEPGDNEAGVVGSQNEAVMQHPSHTNQKDDDVRADLAEAGDDEVGSQNEDVMQHPSHTNQKYDDVPAHLAEQAVTEYILVPSETTEDSFILQPIPSTSWQVLEPLGEDTFNQNQHPVTVSIGHSNGIDEFGTDPIADISLLDISLDGVVGENQEKQTTHHDNEGYFYVEDQVRDPTSNQDEGIFGENQNNLENILATHEYSEGDEDSVEDNNGNFNHSMEIAGKRKRAKRGKADKTLWTAEKNKIKRAKGEDYYGRNKNEQGKTIFDKKRPKKVLKPRCKCKDGPKVVFKCSTITEDARLKLFIKFWNLNRGEKKIFVEQLVDKKNVSHRRVEASSSRRTHSLFYHLKVNDNGDRVRVCKTMFLNTFSLGEWSVLNWVCPERTEETSNDDTSINKRKKGPSEERNFIKQYLDSLPKLESHYCRKDTKKLYLEAIWQSKSELYREYKAFCTSQNKDNLHASVFTFWSVFEECNLGLFSPKKDQCDVCCSFSMGNLNREAYDAHQKRKEEARKEKSTDKEDIEAQRTAVFTLDVQAVLLSPSLKASALYYRTKLKVHNFTIFNLKTADAYCYLWDETEGGVNADEFVSIVCHFLFNEVDKTKYDSVILYSDGCTSQNRNCVLSNALLLTSKQTGLIITQKYLEKGHTQMECDSIHSTIEKRLRNREIYSPAGYVEVCKTARINPRPYQVKYLDHIFFKKYSALHFISSIRPGTKKGDPVVTDLKCLKYTPMGSLEVKLSFAGNFFELPRRITKPTGEEVLQPLYRSKIPLESIKFKHLQEMKPVLPKDIHPYYDTLPHFLLFPGRTVCNGRQGCPCLINCQ